MNTEKIMGLLVVTVFIYIGMFALLSPVAGYLYFGVSLGAAVFTLVIVLPVACISFVAAVDIWRSSHNGSS